MRPNSSLVCNLICVLMLLPLMAWAQGSATAQEQGVDAPSPSMIEDTSAERFIEMPAAEAAVIVETVPVAPEKPAELEPQEPGVAARLDEVLVTATKRGVSVRSIAGSVSAITGADLEKSNAQSMEDYLKRIPGVSLNKGDTETNSPVIRGIATETYFQSNQLPTGIYLDDVAFNDPIKPISTPDINPFDIDRVEVLKGPQGALFGSASLAGAIRYITEKPELGIWSSKLMLTGSQYAHGPELRDGGVNPVGALMINAPLGDTLAIRAVGLHREESGYVDELRRGDRNVNTLKQSGGRVLALWTPTEKLRINGMYLSQRTASDDVAFSDTPDAWTRSNTPTPSPVKTSVTLGNLSAEYDFDFASLLSSTSITGKSADRMLNVDRNFGLTRQSATHAMIFSDGNGDGFTQEIRWTSTDNGGPWKWLAGGFFSRYKMDYGQIVNPSGGTVGDVLDLIQIAIPGGLALPPETTLLTLNSKFLQKESAVFAEASRIFFEDFELTAGMRYYRTALNADLSSAGALALVTGGSLRSQITDSTSERGISPKVSLNWKPSSDLMLYASVSRGFRPGGIQIVPSSIPGTGNGNKAYKSDTLWNYEIGVRSRWFETVTIDAAVFYLDWKNLQVFQYDRFTIASFIDNVGRAHSKGLEAAINWRPLTSWLNGFTITSSTALIDARTDVDFNGDKGLVPAGTPLPGSSRFQASNNISYLLPISSFNTTFSVSHSYVGRAFNNLYKKVEVGDYSTIDARVGLSPTASEKPVEISIWGHNLLDTPGVSSAFSGSFAGNDYTDYYLIAPRSVGVSLTLGF